MKPLSKILTELGIAFAFPIEIKDANGNLTYYEGRNGLWERWERDANGKATCCDSSRTVLSEWEHVLR